MQSNLEIKIFGSLQESSEFAAALLAIAAREAVRSRGRFHLVLSGGETPTLLFRLLTQKSYRTKIPWSSTHIFWGDERNVPPDDNGSNYGQAKKIMLDELEIPDENIHRIKGELKSIEAVADYKRELNKMATGNYRWPIFDLILLGLGEDGHTASLFPGRTLPEDASVPVQGITADYGGRPANRITLTPPVFNSAREILFLVAGKSKAMAVSSTLEGPEDLSRYPAQGIQPVRGKIWWLLDDDAASLLTTL
jgi:6-phosphogluconolactonase